MEQDKLTHIDVNGAARMVDVGMKRATRREATAQAVIAMKPETLELILSGGIPKGDVFACARIAGIMAAKRTPELIPLCHTLPLTSVEVDINAISQERVRISATVKCDYVTGAEMEALTAASVAALTVYDMCKAVDKRMEIGEIRLLKKTGGKSGNFQRDAAARVAGLFEWQPSGAHSRVNRLTLKAAGNVPGENSPGAEEWQVMIADADALKAAQASGKNHFTPNIAVTGLDFAALIEGATLAIGDCRIQIACMGKAFSPFRTAEASENCSALRSVCAFGRVLRGGIIAESDEIMLTRQ